jgi:predicted transcriptional regulator YheO
MVNDTISQIRAAQAPLRRQYTKQQVKLLSQTGILKVQDANQSITERKAKDAAAEKR